jgi:hypothetical protein
MWNSLRTLGSLSIALLLGTGAAWAGELSNVTVGRFQDFTVVTLFGDGPMTVTHQIVEAKDGKPHRIVVDVTGAQHKLPQNNFTELPAGSIGAIRTSQFAVSPEPVVRVVLDLDHPAAYRLETPENQVRIMVSLPGDPPMAIAWSARDGGVPPAVFEEPAMMAEQSAPAAEMAPSAEATAPAQESPTAEATASEAASSDANETSQAAEPAPEQESVTGTEQSTPESATPASEPAAPVWENPAKSTAPEGEVKALPVAPAGALAVSESEAAANATEESATDEPSADVTTTEPLAAGTAVTASPEALAAQPTGQEASPEVAEQAAPMSEPAEPKATSTTETWAEAEDAPQVPMPDHQIEQPERVIDYNLPVPAALAQDGAEAESPEPAAPAEPQANAPKLAVKAPPEGEPTAAASEAAPAPTGADAAVTDVGSAPVASLSTLPPIAESAQDLVPERKQVIYHTHGRRDPFKALLTAGGYNAAALPDISSLRLVGVLQDVKESWGLFEDANGFGYILRKGDRVKNGSLTQLTNNRAYFNLTEFGWSRSVHIDLEPEG